MSQPVECLTPAPATLVEDGAPRFGSWSGSVADTTFDRLAAPFARGLARKLREKKWIYLLTSTPEVFVCLGIVDAGYLHSGFCGVLDRASGKLLSDANPVLPPVCARVSEEAALGPFAKLVGPGVRAAFAREGANVRVTARISDCSIDLTLDSAAAFPPLSTCASLGPDRFDVS